MAMIDDVKQYTAEGGGDRSPHYLIGLIQGQLRSYPVSKNGLTAKQAAKLADEIEAANHWIIWGS